MSESQSTQTLRGFTPFSVQTSGDSMIFDSMSLEDLEVEMELSQKRVANILKAQNSLKSEPQSETENMESTSLTDIELAEIIWDAMKPQRDDEDEDAEVASVTEPKTVDLVADSPYGFLQLPEAKRNSQWYIKRLRLYSEIECRLLGVRMQEESKKYCLLKHQVYQEELRMLAIKDRIALREHQMMRKKLARAASELKRRLTRKDKTI